MDWTLTDDIAPAAVKCFKIPTDAIDDARLFLDLSGTNPFSIFPDLGGLAKEIRRKELSGLFRTKNLEILLNKSAPEPILHPTLRCPGWFKRAFWVHHREIA